MHPQKVAFLDSVHPILEERLEASGMLPLHCESVSRSDILNGHLSSKFGEIHGVVLRSRLRLDAEIFNALPHLKWIARSGSGLENIDTVEAEKRGIGVFNSPEGNAPSVGEHVVGQLLMLLHKLHHADRHVRSGQWDREAHRGKELSTMTVGIIGFGHMGRSVAKRLKGFGCRILVYDKYVHGFDGTDGVEEVTMEVLKTSADIITLHIPLTGETKAMVDREWLHSFANPILFINSSRGGIVQTEALNEALKDGSVQMAALDVLEYELDSLEGLSEHPAALNELLNNPSVVLSPHVAGWSVESYHRLSDVLADKILLFISENEKV